MAPSAREYVGVWDETTERLAEEPRVIEAQQAAAAWLPRLLVAVLLASALLAAAAKVSAASSAAHSEPSKGGGDQQPFLGAMSLGPSGAAPPSNTFLVPLPTTAEAVPPQLMPAPVPVPPAPAAAPASAPPAEAVSSPEPTPAPPAVEAGPVLAPAGANCADAAANCWETRCCQDEKHTCFMKDSAWAGCMETCTPGKHAKDPQFAQTDWNCFIVPQEGPAVDPSTDPAPTKAAALPEAPQPQAPAPTKAAVAALGHADGKHPTLFCMEIIRKDTYEKAIVQKQVDVKGSIFGCETAVVLSDEPVDFGSGVHAITLGDLSTGAGVRTHFANTDIFSRAFDLLKDQGEILKHDFTVKVDPDAVFLPKMLKERIQLALAEETKPKVYFQNCFFQDKNWMFGAIEVISAGALEAYYGGRDTVCKQALDYDNMGEDTFLARCLDHLDVRAIADFDLLSDGYCSEAPGDCSSGQVTYHPFKDPSSWEACFRSAAR